MLEEIARLFVCFALGEILSRSGLLPFPGSVIGLVLLYINLMILGRLPAALGTLADNVLGFLGMLFVPAGVGVLAYLDLFRTEAVPIAAAVLGGTAVTVVVTAITADRIIRSKDLRLTLPETSDVTA